MSRDVLEQRFLQVWPRETWQHTRQLLAVSGGADSVALLRSVLRLAPDSSLITVAHFNHAWRGQESEDDQVFVQELCKSLSVELRLGRATVATDAEKSEARARRDRYDFLVRTAYEVGARYVLTGHTANDRVETLLHNLFRGTGLPGVASPVASRPLDAELVLARPLILCTRDQVLDYLTQRQQAFRTDSSNADETYRRNFLRSSLLPLLREQYGPQVDARLQSFSELAEETVLALRQLAEDYCVRVAERSDNPYRKQDACVQLPTFALLSVPWPVAREALYMLWLQKGWSLREMTRDHWQKIRYALQGADETLALPGALQLVSHQGWVVIRQQPLPEKGDSTCGL